MEEGAEKLRWVFQHWMLCQSLPTKSGHKPQNNLQVIKILWKYIHLNTKVYCSLIGVAVPSFASVRSCDKGPFHMLSLGTISCLKLESSNELIWIFAKGILLRMSEVIKDNNLPWSKGILPIFLVILELILTGSQGPRILVLICGRAALVVSTDKMA